jgi:hypothetical protein
MAGRDHYIYEQSFRADTIPNEIFSSRVVTYVNDSNSSNYSSNQIVFDLAAFFNSEKMTSLSEAMLVIPTVIVMNHDDNANAFENADYGMGWKSLYANMISSISFQYRSTDVVQITPNSEYYRHFVLHSTWSHSDVDIKGDLIGYRPDRSDSHVYSDTATRLGVGSINCFGAPTEYSANTPNLSNPTIDINFPFRNDSMFKRMTATNRNIDTNPVFREANADREYFNYIRKFTAAAGAHANDYYAYYNTLVIRLKDLSDFFNQMPLSKGIQGRLILNVNTGFFVVSQSVPVVGPPATGRDLTLVSTSFQSTCPIMLNSASPGINTNTVARRITVSLGIAQQLANTGQPQVNSHPLRQCRIYAPIYTLKPEYAIAYDDSNRIKTIEYLDLFSTSFTVNAGSQINQIITPSISRAKRVIVIPFYDVPLDGANAGSVVAASSPFASEPSTTSPYASLTQINLQVAGMNIFQSNIEYTFDNFVNEWMSSNSVNGALFDGISSNLISKAMWERNYRYVVLDCSQAVGENTLPLSLTLIATNNTLKNMRLYCFVEYERKITLNSMTGEVVM